MRLILTITMLAGFVLLPCALQAQPMDSCTEQGDCVDFEVMNIAPGDACSESCEFDICATLNFDASCVKTVGGVISHTCFKDGGVCDPLGSYKLESVLDGFRQCQIVSAGSSAEFVFKDGITCGDSTVTSTSGDHVLNATCVPRGSGVTTCTGPALEGTECIWTVVAPACPTPIPPTATPTPTPTVSATPTVTLTPTPEPTATTASLDHFACYKAGATGKSVKFPGIPNPPGVSLVDQFGSATVAVKKPIVLCAPTNKLGEDATAPMHAEHLEGYQIKNSEKPTLPTHVTVVDQFNPGGIFVDVKKQSHLLVPTAKSLAATPPTPAAFVTDHFECYKVATSKNTPKFVPVPGVTLEDQFGATTVTVKVPKFLCAPVDKNGEDVTAPTHVAHLMCYQVKQTSLPKFAKRTNVFTNNQFGSETLDVKAPGFLCVPALKTL